jgi:hypothetical protein
MIVVMSHHWCKPNMVDAARDRIDQNGRAMTAEPGFLYRYRVERPGEPDIVSTLTAWQDDADYQRFRGKRSGQGLKDTPYDRIESEVFFVRHTAGDDRAS